MENVKVRVKNGKTVLIKDVWRAPDMKSNLMSVCQLIEKGFSVNMKDNLLKLYDSYQKMVMHYEQGSNKTFKVNMEIVETKCLSAEVTEGDSKLWHMRLGNLNFRSLWHLSSKNWYMEFLRL